MKYIINGNQKEHTYKKSTQKYELTGQRFGYLTVLERSFYPTIGSRGYTAWFCRCDCGKERTVLQSSLLRGMTKGCGSCGQMKIGPRPSGFNRLVGQYKCDAKRRNLQFELSKDQVFELTTKDCSYCGAPPSKSMGSRAAKRAPVFIYNGIDRVDSTKNYTIDNVVTACKTCNFAKCRMPKDEFLAWVERVHSYQNRSKAAEASIL